MRRILLAVIIALAAGVPSASAEYKDYIGDFHSHTSYSDGMGVPDEAYDMARNDAKTDFWSVTDHYEQLDYVEGLPAGSPKLKEYDAMHDRALAKTEDGKFLALNGFEWFDQSQGHINVLNSPDVPKFGQTYNMKFFYKWVVKHPNALIGFNHPSDSAENKWKSFDDFTYAPEIASQTFFIAVNNDKDFAFYYMALDKGWRLAPSGQQDNHTKNWGLSPSGCFTVVLAESLNYNSLIEAFAARRFYAVNNRNFRLRFQVGDAEMGAEVNGSEVVFKISALLIDKSKIAAVSLIGNGGKVLQEWKPGADKASYEFKQPVDFDGERWFVAVARDTNGKYAVSAPIWVSK